MKPIIISKKVLWEGRFLKSIQINYKNSKGKIIEWEAFQRKKIDGIVATVAFTKSKEVILVKQYRPPIDKYVIEFPAGLNDKKETFEETAKRELLEETGYKANIMLPLIVGPLSSGTEIDVLKVYLALDVIDTGKQYLDEVEDNIEVLKLPMDNFYNCLFQFKTEDTYIDLKVPGLFEIAVRKLKKFCESIPENKNIKDKKF